MEDNPHPRQWWHDTNQSEKMKQCLGTKTYVVHKMKRGERGGSMERIQSWTNQNSEWNAIIQQSVERIFRHQQEDGRFSFYCEVSPWANAIAIIVAYLCHQEQYALITELKRNLLRQQNSNGGWSLYPDQPFHLSASVLSYFALLLAGHPRNSTNMQQAESMILEHGGLNKTSSLARAFLAVAGQVPWSTLPDTHIELIFESPESLLSIYDFSVPMRVHMPSIMILSHLNFKVAVPESCTLRHLILPGQTFPKERFSVRNDEALFACKKFLFERLELDGTIAGYLSATSLFAFACLALGFKTSDGPVVSALSGIYSLVYPSRRTLQQQMFTSDIWDTALGLQALVAAGVNPQNQRMIRAATYLVSKQHQGISDWVHHAPKAKPGGWAFSGDNTHYPDLDDTAAVLKALRPFQKNTMYRHPWLRGARWALAMQNNDGGWGAFEKNVNNPLLHFISGADLPGVMRDPSSPDVTGRVLNAIAHTSIGTNEIRQRAVAWLLSTQHEDGAWQGRWGISFIYGTYHAVKGLRAAGYEPDHSAIVRARKWLESVQNDDGGFGESCASDRERRFISLNRSLPSQTAWGLLGLLSTTKGVTSAIFRAAQWLVSNYEFNGWSEKYPTGAGVVDEVYIRYHSYPRIWPLMALGKFRRRVQTTWQPPSYW
jgi:sporulenol synthase